MQLTANVQQISHPRSFFSTARKLYTLKMKMDAIKEPGFSRDASTNRVILLLKKSRGDKNEALDPRGKLSNDELWWRLSKTEEDDFSGEAINTAADAYSLGF